MPSSTDTPDIFTAEDFQVDWPPNNASDSAATANARLREYCKGLPKRLFDELHWSVESDQHFRKRATMEAYILFPREIEK